MSHVAREPIDELREDHLVIRRFEVGRFDPYALIASIPRHKSYRVFSRPDGPMKIGMGAAARVASRPSAKPAVWRELFDALAASLGAAGPLATIFFSAAFDHEQPFDERWHGFAPVELCVPDIVWSIEGSTHTMTIVATESAFEKMYNSGIAALNAAAKVSATAQPAIAESSFGDALYASAVGGALERIATGEAEKIVVARAIDVVAEDDLQVPTLMAELADRFPNCFGFAFRPGGSHKGASPTFLGATPERLVAVRDRRVETGAIAGTAPRGVSARMDERHAQALLTSDKEMREHDLVGQMIVDALEPLCGRVERESVRFLKLANVQHLWTPISGELEASATIVDVAQALHPTPAVGGHPRTPAVRAIRQLERDRRGLYAGVVGTVDIDGSGELAVAIRSALVHGRTARVFAGAGVVAGSDPEREVAETRAKSRAILDPLGAP